VVAITFDKFHVFKEVNEAMDELRKLERKGNEMLQENKHTFLKSKLIPEMMEGKDFLLELYPKLGHNNNYLSFFIMHKEEDESYLAFWYDYAVDSGIFQFQQASKTIKAHWL
jgi:transposase